MLRVLHIGTLSGPDHSQNLVPMPPKKELKLDKLQQHLGDRVTPAQLLLKELECWGRNYTSLRNNISKERAEKLVYVKTNMATRSNNGAR